MLGPLPCHNSKGFYCYLPLYSATSMEKHFFACFVCLRYMERRHGVPTMDWKKREERELFCGYRMVCNYSHVLVEKIAVLGDFMQYPACSFFGAKGEFLHRRRTTTIQRYNVVLREEFFAVIFFVSHIIFFIIPIGEGKTSYQNMAKPPSPSPSPSPSSADSAASTTTAAPPSALPTAEAIEVLLSPDGYYRYLGIPLPAPDVLGPKYQEVMGPDTTTADDVVGGSPNGGAIDLDLVKRNYRRLSLRHHPDRRTGDAETFRALNRAKVVLSNPKLRREYDLVGLDLDDDADDHTDHHHHHHHGPADGNVGKSDASAGGRSDRNNGEPHRADDGAAGRDDGAGGAGGGGGGSKTETVMGHLASATLAAVLQVVVRTGLMGAVSVLISRYTILVSAFVCSSRQSEMLRLCIFVIFCNQPPCDATFPNVLVKYNVPRQRRGIHTSGRFSSRLPCTST